MVISHLEAASGPHRLLKPTFAALLLIAALFAFTATSAKAATPFGISQFSTEVSSSQAGAHADFTTTFSLNKEELGGPAGQLKNVHVELPEGLVGDPQAIPRCTTAQLTEFDCQPSAQVGVLTTKFAFPAKEPGGEPEDFEEQTGIYNMVPSPGHPATLATSLALATVLIQADVKRDGSYRLEANVREISTLEPVVSTAVTLWGVPADASHDNVRFGPPPNYGTPTRAGIASAPFMINSSDCSDGALESKITAESWDGATSAAQTSMQAPTGCAMLKAAPTIDVQPATTQAGAPAGYDVTLGVPQELEPYALATPDLRDATVTFPAGTAVNPSAANGLQACSLQQIGLSNGNPVGCPDASKLGTVEVTTPLLAEPLQGNLYAAAQNANPFGSLLAVYLVVEGSGVQVKLAGRVTANPVNGQLSTNFSSNPQFPFSKLKVHLFPGNGAVLSNPTACGAATTTSQLTFYSSAIPQEPSSAFNVTGCTPGQFNPSFAAGTSNPRAGTYSPLTVTIGRSDADQDISGVQTKLPGGLEAILAGVPLCGEPQASQGQCPASTQIGHVVSGAGAGPEPVYLPQAGQGQDPVYLTGGYKGGPYGLSIVVPAVAGPFNLGTVVVRARIDVDPTTAQAIVTADPLPQILQGIPLQVKSINVTIDRANFAYNATGCEPRSATATITSIGGVAANVSSPYQAGSCAALPFKPSFAASTQANGAIKPNGESLTVKIKTKQGPTASGGGESNIAKVAVQLPVALPSRLSTLQKACTEKQFAANPAGCPAAAFVGTAVAHTPVLPDPVQGPALLVSHGGAAFPDLVLYLQGDGVTVVLTGHTQIKNGITYSHFETVPDAPISSFELKLPEGPNSILAAIVPEGKTLCTATGEKTVKKTVTVKVKGKSKKVKRSVKVAVAAPLLMPTTITAQNGAVVKQTTKISIVGCPKAAKAAKAKKAKKARRARTAHTKRKAARR